MLSPLQQPQHTDPGQPESKQPKIGELLVQENFITPLDCKQVLDIQEKEKIYTGLPLLRILTESGRLSEKQKNRLLALPDIEKEITKTIIKNDILTEQRLETCINSKNAYQTLPEALIAQNILSKLQVDFLLYEQLDPEILSNQGEIMGIITSSAIDYYHKVSKSPRSFGEICCSLDLITPLDLYHLLEKHGKQIKFGEILIHLNYCDEEAVNKAIDEQKHTNKLIGEILIDKQAITPEQCQEALSLQANIPFDRLEDFHYDDFSRESLPRLISANFAEEHLLLPISILNRSMKLALMQPEAIQGTKDLMALYKQLHIECVLVPEQRFCELFEELYSEPPSLEIRKTLLELKKKQQFPENTLPDFMHIDLNEDLETEALPDPLPNEAIANIEDAIHSILSYGIEQGASDIHLEQDGKGLTIRYRIDGVIKAYVLEWLQLFLLDNSGALISRIKVMSNLDLSEKRVPQYGVFQISHLSEQGQRKSQLEFRVASCPSITGESITIHILDPRKAKLSLRQNGHSPHVLEPFARRLNSDANIILVAGPNGCGKSSTLYGALKLIYDPSLKILTAEDPIEYNFPGIIQTQVNPKLGLNFAQLLRSFLSLDPDIIMVGELRDKATATLAFDAAQAGHLVLSSLAANDSISTLFRLLDMGIDRSRIAASLSCVLAQRLVRKICPSCITEYQPEPREWSLIFNKYPAHLQFFQGSGCESCGYTGFKGRTVLSEIFPLTNPNAFMRGAELSELKETALLRGMKTMVHDGLLKMSSTTLSEISRVLPFVMLDSFRRHENYTTTRDNAMGAQFLIRNPKQEGDTLEGMLTHFNTLLKSSGANIVSKDKFDQFISANFRQICADHGGEEVLFTLKKDADGKVEILAQPEGGNN